MKTTLKNYNNALPTYSQIFLRGRYIQDSIARHVFSKENLITPKQYSFVSFDDIKQIEFKFEPKLEVAAHKISPQSLHNVVTNTNYLLAGSLRGGKKQNKTLRGRAGDAEDIIHNQILHNDELIKLTGEGTNGHINLYSTNNPCVRGGDAGPGCTDRLLSQENDNVIGQFQYKTLSFGEFFHRDFPRENNVNYAMDMCKMEWYNALKNFHCRRFSVPCGYSVVYQGNRINGDFEFPNTFQTRMYYKCIRCVQDITNPMDMECIATEINKCFRRNGRDLEKWKADINVDPLLKASLPNVEDLRWEMEGRQIQVPRIAEVGPELPEIIYNLRDLDVLVLRFEKIMERLLL